MVFDEISEAPRPIPEPRLALGYVSLVPRLESSLGSGRKLARSPAPGQSPSAIFQQPISELSAEHAASERSKMYRAGVAYSHWIDQIAKDTGNAFLQQRLFDRVTWMRLLACGGGLILLGLLTGWFLWIVRRKAGRIESDEHQSWVALTAAAIRKPLTLLAWVVCGFLALIPIVEGI